MENKVLLKKQFLAYFIYLFINLIFVYKYSFRIETANPWLICGVYSILNLATMLFMYRVKVKSNYFRYLFWIIGILFLIFTIVLNYMVDGESLNVDRWSAMQVAIEALINGEYPYSAIDHLNGHTSNLPTLIFLGIPFYFIGNIGLLQSLAFFVLVYLIHKIFDSYRIRLICLMLFVLSPAYMWEIYAKSDLMTNFILVILFLWYAQSRWDKRKGLKITVISFLSTALLMTRLTVVIPLILLLFKKLVYLSLKEKLTFAFIGLLTAIIFLFLCFRNVGSMEVFMSYNPFMLQNRQLPFFISLATVLLPFIYSFKIHSFSQLIAYSAIFLLIPIFLSFILNVSNNGYVHSIIDSGFDISYFNICLPFIVIRLCMDLNKNQFPSLLNRNNSILSE